MTSGRTRRRRIGCPSNSARAPSVIANSRGPASLTDLAAKTGATCAFQGELVSHDLVDLKLAVFEIKVDVFRGQDSGLDLNR